MVPGGLAFLVAGIATILVHPVPSFAQNGVTPGQRLSYSTISPVGVEGDPSGDVNHNATVNVQYRIQGASAWKSALPLVRVDNTYNGNGFAGSILFLNPDTTYEVVLNLSDPDGGAENRILTVATRLLPMLPTGGRTFHVVPGRSEEHTSELQSQSNLVCRLLLEKKKKKKMTRTVIQARTR